MRKPMVGQLRDFDVIVGPMVDVEAAIELMLLYLDDKTEIHRDPSHRSIRTRITKIRAEELRTFL